MKHQSTILIVDDQLHSRETLRKLLNHEGYNLGMASNGIEALQKAAELMPDVILLDVMMQGMNGFEVCQRLRNNPRLAEVPVVMVTALDDYKSHLRAIEAGADDFISKPFDVIQLLARVRTITQLNRYRRLNKERAKFDWVVEKSADGYLVIDENDQILYANPKARLYLSLPEPEEGLVGLSFLEQASIQNYRFEPEQNWLAWPSGLHGIKQSPRYLVRPESLTNHVFWLQVDALKLPAGPDGDWMIHLHDVTRQMALQSRMWSFQTSISHKLQTPLYTLLMGLELLENEGITQSLGDELGTLFELALESATRLQKDVQDILQYLDTSQLAPLGAGFTLSRLEPIIRQIAAALEIKALTISNQLAEDTTQTLLSEHALELMLHEIFENARKFHPQQSPQIEINLLPQGKSICILICDNGLSLTPEQLAKIWTPYYQAEKSFTGQVTGMGLGLSMVAALIWNIGGQCQAYNRTDRAGIVIELTIPLAQ